MPKRRRFDSKVVYFMPKPRKRFDSQLSRQIDATHLAIDALRSLPPTPERFARLIALYARLRYLQARIPHD